MTDESHDLNWHDLYDFEIVAVEDIEIDRTYNRSLNEKWVADRSTDEGFKPALLGTVVLSEKKGRGRRKFVSFDGQHRIEICRRRGITHVPALVYQGLTRAQEAQLFADLQTERRGMHSYVRYNAALVAGNPETTDIERIVVEQGFRTAGQQGPYTITAVASLEKIYRMDPIILEATLRVIGEAWQGDIPTGTVIVGIARFIEEWGLGRLDMDVLARRLGTLGIPGLMKRAHALKDSRGVSGGIATMDVMHIVETAYRRQGGRAAA